MSPPRCVRAAWIVSLGLGLGCTGEIAAGLADPADPAAGPRQPGDPDRPRTGGASGATGPIGGAGSPTAPVGPVAAVGEIVPVPTTRFARLSHEQWENTVRDLLGLPARPGLSSSFERDAVVGFDNEGGALSVSENLRIGYEAAAEQLAADAVSTPERLARIAPDAGADVKARGRAFIARFGARAYRRPLDAAEEQQYAALFDRAPALLPGMDPWKAGVQLTLHAVLQAPGFLYRTELGTRAERGRIALDAHELAAKLSYALTTSMPDDTLAAAARSGLGPEALAREARRLLASPRAQETMDHFHFQWLALTQHERINKDRRLYPEFSPALIPDIIQESTLFLRHLFGSNGGFTDILTAPYTFANKRLGAVYGVNVASDQPVKTELDPARRAGLLTQVGFLASHAGVVETDIIHRGVFVNRDILCFPLPPPVDDVPPLPASTARTNRARVEMFTGKGTCGEGCHSTFINPPGLAFENYDALGRYRTTDNGEPIDAGGSYPFKAGPRSWKTAVELIGVLAESPEAHGCYARQLLSFAYGRNPVDADAALLESLGRSSLARASTRDLLEKLVTSVAFTTRLP